MDYKLEEQALTSIFTCFKGWFFDLFIPTEKNDYMPKFLQNKWLFFVAVAILLIKVVAVGVSINFPKNIFFADITKTNLINLVNQSREEFGLAPLLENQKLDQAAELKAKDMLTNGYFYHISPTGVTPWHWFEVAGYNYKYAGENLAIGFVESEEVYRAWYDSLTHRDNILSPYYTEVGTAILKGFGENKAVIVVQLFGTEKKYSAPVALVQEQHPTTKEIAQQEQPAEVAEVITEQEPLVLSGSTVVSDSKNQTYLKYLNILAYSYEKIIQYIIYAFIAIMGFSLLLNVFVNINVQRKDLILRSVVIITVLFTASVISKDIVVQIIPHTVTI